MSSYVFITLKMYTYLTVWLNLGPSPVSGSVSVALFPVCRSLTQGSFTYQLTLKMPILGPPLADTMLTFSWDPPPPLADSQHPSKKCRTQEVWSLLIKIFHFRSIEKRASVYIFDFERKFRDIISVNPSQLTNLMIQCHIIHVL